ncbi:MAG: Trk system potassium transporter TrkA [Cyclonatronaceae bacterium]
MNILIIGAGEIGQHLAGMLTTEKHDVTLIDEQEDILDEIGQRHDLLTVNGSATSGQTLVKADVRKMDLVIAVTNVDEINMIAAMMSKRLGAKKTVVRIRNDEFSDPNSPISPSDIGIDVVIQPELSTANEILQLVKRASANDVVSLGNSHLQLVGIRINTDSLMCNRPLSELAKSNDEFVFRVVAIQRGDVTIIPNGDDKILKHDTIFVVLASEHVNELMRMTGHENKPVRSVMIAGGKSLGAHVLRKLEQEKSNWEIKLIEADQQCCYKLASENSKALILNGEPSDTDLLANEGISETDIFISVTEDEESNIVNCLLANHLKVGKTIALVSQPAYISLAQTIGLGTAVNKKLSAATEIHHHILKGRVHSVAALHGIPAEMLELGVKNNCKAINKPLYKAKLPEACMVASLTRPNGDVEVATGQTYISAGDRVWVLALSKHIESVTDYFT